MEKEQEFRTSDIAQAPDRAGTASERTDDDAQARGTVGEPEGAQSEGAPSEDARPDGAAAPLIPSEEADRVREQWGQVQGEFVDQPRAAVEQADRLVADLMQRLAAQFSETRSDLERRWDGQEDVSTEDLRVAMTQYRSFFERLLQA
jgi:hypothetical protein